jgi:uncharacterized small protein (DUF1192 family)
VSAGAAAENRHLRAQLFRANQEIAELKARIGHLQREIEELRARLSQRAAPGPSPRDPTTPRSGE